MTLRPIVLHQDPTFRFVHLGCVIAAVWLDAPTLDQMKTFSKHARAVSRATEGSALFNLVIDGTPRFDSAVRAEAEALIKESVNRRGAIHVILVDGLRGAATRAFLSGIAMLRPSTTPTKVVGDLGTALKHMRSFLGPRAEAEPVLLERFVTWSIARDAHWPAPWT